MIKIDWSLVDKARQWDEMKAEVERQIAEQERNDYAEGYRDAREKCITLVITAVNTLSPNANPEMEAACVVGRNIVSAIRALPIEEPTEVKE